MSARYSLSPLAATLMNLHASVADKRLTPRLSPLDATLTKNRGRVGLVLYLLNLLYILYFPQNGNALSAAMGAAAKRAYRLQERRSLLVKDSVVRRRRRRRQSRQRRRRRSQKFSVVALLDGVVRGHCKQRRRRLRPLNIRQRVGCIAKPGIRISALDDHLQL